MFHENCFRPVGSLRDRGGCERPSRRPPKSRLRDENTPGGDSDSDSTHTVPDLFDFAQWLLSRSSVLTFFGRVKDTFEMYSSTDTCV